MPGMDGVEFYERLRSMQPTLCDRVTFVSGGAYTPRVCAFLQRNARPIVDKPLGAVALRQLFEHPAS